MKIERPSSSKKKAFAVYMEAEELDKFKSICAKEKFPPHLVLRAIIQKIIAEGGLPL